MLSLNVGLVAEQKTGISPQTLQKVAQAIQEQVRNDFGPVWGVEATVEALPAVTQLEDVPADCWPVIVTDTAGVPAAGYHLDPGGRPHAVVENRADWSVMASHECLEMLADPFGNRLIPGPSLKDDQGFVEYLVEVCDPCQAKPYQMNVDEEPVDVSDFVTPDFYNPGAEAGKPKTFKGNILKPLEILPDCQLRWYVPKGDHWWQAVRKGDAPPEYLRLGPVNPGVSPREALPLMVLSALAPRKSKAAQAQKLTMRPEFYHLVYRLATDQGFYERFQKDARKVYLEYGIDIPQELLPKKVTLPRREDLKTALDSMDSSLGFAHDSEFALLDMSTCGLSGGP